MFLKCHSIIISRTSTHFCPSTLSRLLGKSAVPGLFSPRLSQVGRWHQGPPQSGRTGILDCLRHQVPSETEEVPKHPLGRNHTHSADASRSYGWGQDRGRGQHYCQAEHGGWGTISGHIQPAGHQSQPYWKNQITGTPKVTSKKSDSWETGSYVR